MTEGKPAPRVLRRDGGGGGGSKASAKAQIMRDLEQNSEIFSDTLGNGRQISLREMTAGDLLYMEKSLGNVGDMERSLKLAARLSCGDGRVTYEDLQRLTMRDLKLVTALLALAGGTDDEEDLEEDEYPND